MNTTANITYLLDRRKAGFSPASLSPANVKAYAMLDELTEGFTDLDMISADESFEKTLDLLVESIKATSGPTKPVKKPLTPTQQKQAASVIKQGRGKRKVDSTAKSDGADFAARMRKAREEKKPKAQQSSAASPKKRVAAKPKTPKAPKTTKETTAQAPNSTEPKTPALKSEDRAYLSAKHVKVPSVELKHIKRFVSLVGEGTKEKIMNALETLQREIKKGILSKKSPFAVELDEIQDAYIAILHGNKAPYKVSLSPDKLAQYVSLAGGEKVYKTVEILLKFIGWTEESKSEEQIKKLLAEIRNAKQKGKIKTTDPYAGEVDELAAMLSKAGSGTRFDAAKVDLQGLSGLAGLGCACKGTVSGLGSLPSTVKGGVISANQLMNFSYPVHAFSGNWGALLGQPQTNAKLMIWGEPGQGKSTLAYQLARYLASSFGSVLYIAQEEINQAGQASMTVQTKLKSVGGPVEGWRFTGDWKKIDGKDPFVFIDSVNSSGLTEEDFAQLTEKFPHVFFVLIFQATKEGKFKGARDWEHLVDIVAKVELGKATTTKNRFAPLSTVTIF